MYPCRSVAPSRTTAVTQPASVSPSRRKIPVDTRSSELIRDRLRIFSPRGIGLLIFSLALILIPVSSSRAQWVHQVSGTESRLRGVSAVSDRVCWATGARGTVLLTTDGGATWRKKTVPGAGNLDFRDVHAFDDRTAYILSIGAGELSRIDKTTDGGVTWAASFRNNDPRGFLDAIAFWDETHGIAQGDPVDGRFLILTTDDGGVSWRPGLAEGMPALSIAKGRSPQVERAWLSRVIATHGFARGEQKQPACSDPPIGVGTGASPTRPSPRVHPPRASSQWHFATPATASQSAEITSIPNKGAAFLPEPAMAVGPGRFQQDLARALSGLLSSMYLDEARPPS